MRVPTAEREGGVSVGVRGRWRPLKRGDGSSHARGAWCVTSQTDPAGATIPALTTA